MTERLPSYFNSELNLPVLSEIKRSYKEEVTLFDWGDALAVDDKIVLAYKNFWVPKRGEGDKILVARERTTPIKIERTGTEIIYPYPNEDELKGHFGVLIIDVYPDRPTFYIGENYKVTFDRSFLDERQKAADITVESTKPIRSEFIDGRMDYNHYLMLLSQIRTQ